MSRMSELDILVSREEEQELDGLCMCEILKQLALSSGDVVEAVFCKVCDRDEDRE